MCRSTVPVVCFIVLLNNRIAIHSKTYESCNLTHLARSHQFLYCLVNSGSGSVHMLENTTQHPPHQIKKIVPKNFAMTCCYHRIHHAAYQTANQHCFHGGHKIITNNLIFLSILCLNKTTGPVCLTEVLGPIYEHGLQDWATSTYLAHSTFKMRWS